jgi:hypothetical protein
MPYDKTRLIDFHPRNVTKPDKSLFEFYEQSSVDFLCDLECCSISYSVDIDLKFDFEEHASSESELFILSLTSFCSSVTGVSGIHDLISFKVIGQLVKFASFSGGTGSTVTEHDTFP